MKTGRRLILVSVVFIALWVATLVVDPTVIWIDWVGFALFILVGVLGIWVHYKYDS